eukprot:CAMPEP_0171178988 /NCGR_PEP_ID=MMETSP0790-20130122/13028_1 /TAXON_ID=2925 /ORGANISM="Alexandrium catenella, Strain OF101" /LENGTH=42 /DNA_ID= /DNA_START= /DNA_END= /DNA_ORIENTATION=
MAIGGGLASVCNPPVSSSLGRQEGRGGAGDDALKLQLLRLRG